MDELFAKLGIDSEAQIEEILDTLQEKQVEYLERLDIVSDANRRKQLGSELEQIEQAIESLTTSQGIEECGILRDDEDIFEGIDEKNVFALCYLGMQYLGFSDEYAENQVERDVEKAILALTKAAEVEIEMKKDRYGMLEGKTSSQICDQGNAMVQLAEIYYQGEEVPKDYEKAVYWYKKVLELEAATRNIDGCLDAVLKDELPKAAFVLASAYLPDEGIHVKNVNEDAKEASKWYLVAAKGGYEVIRPTNGKRTTYALEELFAAREAREKGLEKADELFENGRGAEAVAILEELVEDGHWFPAWKLYNCYADGNGVPQDNEKAVFWLEKAGHMGIERALFQLVRMYFNGNDVASKDNAKAIYWFKKIVEHPLFDNDTKAESAYILGTAYMEDSEMQVEGLVKDDREAFKYFSVAERTTYNVDGEVSYMLGYMYETGRGVERDLEKAKEKYLMGRYNKNEKAIVAYKRLSGE